MEGKASGSEKPYFPPRWKIFISLLEPSFLQRSKQSCCTKATNTPIESKVLIFSQSVFCFKRTILSISRLLCHVCISQHYPVLSVFRGKLCSTAHPPHQIKHLMVPQVAVRSLLFPPENRNKWSIANILVSFEFNILASGHFTCLVCDPKNLTGPAELQHKC